MKPGLREKAQSGQGALDASLLFLWFSLLLLLLFLIDYRKPQVQSLLQSMLKRIY